MKWAGEHFGKLLLTALVGLSVYGARAYVDGKHDIAMLHISYIKSAIERIERHLGTYPRN